MGMAKRGKSMRNNRGAVSSGDVLRSGGGGLSTIMKASGDAFLLFDEKLSLFDINPAGEKLFGVLREAAAGRNIMEFVPDVKEAGALGKYLNVINTGEPFFNEEIIPHPMLGVRHLSIKSFKAGEGLALLVNEIGDSEHQGSAVVELEERCKALLDTVERAGEGVIIVRNVEDKKDAIVYANYEACRMLGYSREEMLGKTAQDFVDRKSTRL